MIQDIHILHWNIIPTSTGVAWNVGPYQLIRLPGRVVRIVHQWGRVVHQWELWELCTTLPGRVVHQWGRVVVRRWNSICFVYCTSALETWKLVTLSLRQKYWYRHLPFSLLLQCDSEDAFSTTFAWERAGTAECSEWWQIWDKTSCYSQMTQN